MFWEIYQQSQIHNAQSAASRAESRQVSMEEQVRLLEDKVDALALTCQAMWEILRERSDVTEDQLMAKANEIDLRDGKADGKMGSGGTPCSKCGRTINKRRARCMYCGEYVGKEHVFQQ